MAEPVCAIATAPGHSAIGTIRITGDGCIPLVQKIFQPFKRENRSLTGNDLHGRAIPGWIRDPLENLLHIDEVITVFFCGPSSYTGEDSAEIQCHGNPVILKKILHLLYATGINPAGPGEFTRRAFLHGKIDLSAAEAVKSIIEARSERELAGARTLKSGRFRTEILNLRSALLNLTADMTAEMDFSDEDITLPTDAAKILQLDSLLKDTTNLLQNSRKFQILHNGVRIAIAGPPNAGKSSLLNFLTGLDRAIVSNEPGTTRDYLDAEILLAGVPVCFTDTAGIRSLGVSSVEKEGIRRSLEKIHESHLNLLVLDISLSIDELNKQLTEMAENHPRFSGRLIILLNKVDLVPPKEFNQKQTNFQKSIAGMDFFQDDDNQSLIIDTMAISILNGDHIKELESRLEQWVQEYLPDDEAMLLSTWQEENLEKIASLLIQTKDLVIQKELGEICTATIEEALQLTRVLSGEVTNEDILGRIFSRFCIGK